MIRSYRSKRRKIQDELELLHNRSTILDSISPTNELVIKDKIIQKLPIHSSTSTNLNISIPNSTPYHNFTNININNDQHNINLIENSIVHQYSEIHSKATNLEIEPNINICSDNFETLHQN